MYFYPKKRRKWKPPWVYKRIKAWQILREIWAKAKKMRDNPTPSEAAAWKLIQKIDSMYEWKPQWVPERIWRNKVQGCHVSPYYILDFYCAGLALDIEIDGASHNGMYAKRQDELRDNYLKNLGITTIRFPDYIVLDNPDHFTNQVSTIIEQREEQLKHGHKTNPV